MSSSSLSKNRPKNHFWLYGLMEGRLRFFFVKFNFFSYILTLISISIIKKNFLGHTDILTYGNDSKVYFQWQLSVTWIQVTEFCHWRPWSKRWGFTVWPWKSLKIFGDFNSSHCPSDPSLSIFFHCLNFHSNNLNFIN